MPTGCTTQPLAQRSVCTAPLTQRCREVRSAVQVQIPEVPEAELEQPAPHTSSTPVAMRTQPVGHSSVCVAPLTQRWRAVPSAVQVQTPEVPEAEAEQSGVQTSSVPEGSAVQPWAQRSVWMALLTQRCRAVRSAVQVQMSVVPDAEPAQPEEAAVQVASAVPEPGVHPLLQTSDCTIPDTQR